MSSLAKWLFKIGYLPIQHESVKRELLNIYYEATRDPYVVEGLDVPESKLITLAINAGNKSENFDEEHPLFELLDLFEEKAKQAELVFHYIAIAVFCILGSTAVAAIYQFELQITRLVAFLFGGALFGTTLVPVSLFHILKHQLRVNGEVVRLFNEELTEKPGDIRRHDRSWNDLAAQYFWNHSLSRPSTIIMLILLSIIRMVSTSLYGYIAGDLQHNVRDFLDKNAGEILKHQAKRIKNRDFDEKRNISPHPGELHDVDKDR